MVYYNDAGTIWAVSLEDAKARRLGLAAEFDVDFRREKRIVFAQAWSLLDRWYADPQFHRVDWPAIEREYAPRAFGARTPDELRRVISLMLGELNSSHLGIGAPRNPAVPRWTSSRFGSDPPERTALGQRALDKLTALVVNEHSLSDAENFTAGYRALRVGPKVGDRRLDHLYEFGDFSRRLDFASPHDSRDWQRRRRSRTPPAARRRARRQPARRANRGDDPQLDAAVRELSRITAHRRVR